MSIFFPRFAFAPATRCAPVFRQAAPSYDISPASLFSLFDDATRQIAQFERQARAQAHRRAVPQFNPRFDVKEEKEAYVLEGEVPGFKDSDLNIEWKDDVLAITGRYESGVEKKPEAQAQAQAVTAAPAAEADAEEGEFEKVEKNEVEAGAEKPASDSGSVKSYQATVEDEEAPANASAVVAESSKVREAEKAPVKAEAPAQPRQPEVQHWISERRTGQFLRKFGFPSNAVDHEAIKASLESGILRIVVPKAPAPESRRINIE